MTIPLVTHEHIEHYWTHGWVVVEGVYTADETTRIARIAEELGWREMAAQTACPVTVDTGGDGQAAPRKIDWAFPKHPAFRQLVLDERLRVVVAAVLRHTPYLVRDQIFLKPAGIGSSKPWHQDQPHLDCEPPDKVIGAWIALDDATADNGCLRYVSGSHRGPLLDHTPMPGAEHNAIPDPEQAKAVYWEHATYAPVQAGGIALHHPYTLHGSPPNRSGRPRRAYSTHWVAADVTSTSGNTLEWAYSRTVGSGRHAVCAP
ncbi:MAG: phytanoyl-CoA dioxygenase family protein [Nocardioides sp.]